MFKIKILMASILLLISILGLTACQQKQNNDVIKVGTIAGPETTLVEVAKDVAKKKYGLDIKIIEFTDYTIPNMALNEGSIDANMIQHQPFLNSEIKNRGFDLVSIGKTFIYPMGIYSKKIKSLTELQNNSIVAIPNDPSNEARALLLLQRGNLIELKPIAGVLATTEDIIKNPKYLQFKELNASQLTRSLEDVTIAVINTNYAIAADLSPTKDALLIENANSPFANIIVIRRKDLNKPALKQLVKALQSTPVLKKAKALFGNDAIPAW